VLLSLHSKLATSNLACSCGLPRPITKSDADEKVGMALTRGALHNLEVPFNIYAMVEASDLKFCTQLGFANAHHKITLREKS